MAIRATHKDERKTALQKISRSLKESFAKIAWQNIEDDSESKRLERIRLHEIENKKRQEVQYTNQATAIMYRRMV